MENRKSNRTARRHRRRRSSQNRRKGAAVVEFAVCLPVLVLITLAFIDLTNYIYFRQSLKIAAYDAARVAARPESTSTDVQNAAERLMDMRGIDNWTLTLPNNYSTVERGTLMTFTLSAPLSEMTHFTGMDFWQSSIGSTVTVNLAAVKE